MGYKFQVWLDSGANIHSKYEQTIDIEELDITNEEWDAMSENEQDEIMRDIAFSRGNWGFTKI